MKTYLCSVLVEFTDSEHGFWSEQSDIAFSLAKKLTVNQATDLHLIAYLEVKNGAIDPYTIFDRDGGI